MTSQKSSHNIRYQSIDRDPVVRKHQGLYL